MRKFALSSGAFPRHKLLDAIHHVALAGYTGIEIVADIPHAYPPLMRDAERKAIRAALAQRRLAVSNVDASTLAALRTDLRPSWIEDDRVLRRERIAHTLDAGKLARELGSPTLSTLAGGEIAPGAPRDPALRLFVAGLKQVAAAVAKDRCRPLLIDPRKGFLIETPAQALDLIRLVASPHVALTLNTGRVLRAGHDPAAAIAELKGALRHVHLEDVARDRSAVVVPGAGQVDFAAVFAALDAIAFEGWLTVSLSGADVHPDEAARGALEFLKRFDK